MSELYLNDISTIIISYTLFWGVILILIAYPKLTLHKIKQKIKNLKKK